MVFLLVRPGLVPHVSPLWQSRSTALGSARLWSPLSWTLQQTQQPTLLEPSATRLLLPLRREAQQRGCTHFSPWAGTRAQVSARSIQCVQAGRKPCWQPGTTFRVLLGFPGDLRGGSRFPSCSWLQPTFWREAFWEMLGSAKAGSHQRPRIMKLKRNSEISQPMSLMDREDSWDPKWGQVLFSTNRV